MAHSTELAVTVLTLRACISGSDWDMDLYNTRKCWEWPVVSGKHRAFIIQHYLLVDNRYEYQLKWSEISKNQALECLKSKTQK